MAQGKTVNYAQEIILLEKTKQRLIQIVVAVAVVVAIAVVLWV